MLLTRSWKGIGCVAAAALAFSACASRPGSHVSADAAPTQPSAAPAAAFDQAGDALDEVLAYTAELGLLSPTALRAEYALVRREHERATTPATALKLAVLLNQRGTPFFDGPKARELLLYAADVTRGDVPTRHLARLLLRQWEETAAIERSLVEERARRQTLEKKLEQLKTIEEEIDRRPATPVVPSR